MRALKLSGAILLAVIVAYFAACERKVVVEGGGADGDQATASFVGSAACSLSACHGDIYASFIKTGHPYKLNKSSDARQPGYYPYGDLPGPPDVINNDWNQVSYVIGGHRWKARFIDLEGYIVTDSFEAQYNIETEEWVGYEGDKALGTLPYKCGPCHMTGYRPGGHQDDLPGMVGTWDAGGIHCEECHGNASLHVKDPYDSRMTVDRSSALCGKCHVRGTPYMIPASGDFVKHHEQFNEILGSKHAILDCVDCHDPHQSLHPDEVNREDAIRHECSSCHWDYAVSFEASEIDHADHDVMCIDCHMPRAAKSAVGVTRILDGDVRSHIFTMNTAADAEQFYTVGSSKFANPYLTLDYMCKKCHEDKDQEWMAGTQQLIHY